MRDEAPGAGAVELRVRLAADPASVPGARRFVADGLLSWGLRDLVDDATLCVSELAGNAALHSASMFMEIAIRPIEESVRITVEDDGAIPVEALVPRQDLPSPDVDRTSVMLDDEPTTGRGLAIVSILASEWGVEVTETGKRVWVDLDHQAEEHGVRLPTTHGHDAPPAEATLPEGWAAVTLVQCPVQLSLRQDQHLDELIRELQLIHGDQENPTSQQLARELQGLLSGPAHARHTGRRIAQQAAAAGKEHIDIEMAMPREFSAEVQALNEAVKAADVLCEEMRLLTLASSPDLRALREWMTGEIVRQTGHDGQPISWPDWWERHG